MDIAVFDALQAARQAKQPVALVTDLASGGQCLLGDDGQVIGASAGAPNLTTADIAAVLTRLGDDRSGRLDDAGLFVHVHSPAPRLLIVNQPTWGVDAGAAAVIRQALIALAADGAAVLMISQDLDEIFAVADRVAVIARGRLAPARPVTDISRRDIGLLMAGLPVQAAS